MKTRANNIQNRLITIFTSIRQLISKANILEAVILNRDNEILCIKNVLNIKRKLDQDLNKDKFNFKETGILYKYMRLKL